MRIGGSASGLHVRRANLESALAEVTKNESELIELENAVKADQATSAKTTCLSRLEEKMRAVVAEMVSSGNVLEGDLRESVGQMDVLFQGLTTVSTKAQARALQRTTVTADADDSMTDTPCTPSVAEMLRARVVPFATNDPSAAGFHMSGAATGGA